MQKRISRAEATPVKVVIVTMDTHVASATDRARATLAREIPGLTLSVHAASEFAADPDGARALPRGHRRGRHHRQHDALPRRAFHSLCFAALAARRDHCDAMICVMSAGEVAKLTRMGRFDMSAPTTGFDVASEDACAATRGKSEPGGRQADEDAAPSAEDSALHSRHGAGRARLFPDAAILARGFRREHRPTWSAFSSIVTPTARGACCAAR